jgi:GNAT superfamily N-acetyltransferase
MDVTIRTMIESDIDAIVAAFVGWHKERPQYEGYFAEQESGQRTVLVALDGDSVIAYGTLIWQPEYAHFREQNIPEIVDLNVITPLQGQGIGTALIRRCEQDAAARGYQVIGISVVMDDPDYAAARRLYPYLGYVPDGYGITPEDNELHLTKRLDNTSAE